jgi:hypothetical protein
MPSVRLLSGEAMTVAAEANEMESVASDQSSCDAKVARLAKDSLPADVNEAVSSVDRSSGLPIQQVDSSSAPSQSVSKSFSSLALLGLRGIKLSSSDSKSHEQTVESSR